MGPTEGIITVDFFTLVHYFKIKVSSQKSRPNILNFEGPCTSASPRFAAPIIVELDSSTVIEVMPEHLVFLMWHEMPEIVPPVPDGGSPTSCQFFLRQFGLSTLKACDQYSD